MVNKKKAVIVGATGIAGQQFVAALQDHPWFDITGLAASERSAGKSYSDALKDPSSGAMRWWCTEQLNERVGKIKVEDGSKIDVSQYDVVFTALESDAAKILEPMYAKEKPVISTASAFRYEDDVPIIIPGVNLEHTELLEAQKKKRGWKGFVTPIPNCTTTGLVATLKPLYDEFGINKVLMTSMQAVSGAGRSPGVPALDILDNIIPFIRGEEEKVEKEVQKILGKLEHDKIHPIDLAVSCTCTRAAVLDGHTEAAFVSLKKKASIDDVKRAFEDAGKELTKLGLPSAPKKFITLHEDPFRPQPRIDRDADGGMTTSVGRIRVDNALENGIKYVLVSHNTKAGAAKGAVLVAEYLVKKGKI
ncbi:Aspartate-semialdehyde dehydrogenase [Candidatus Gugararchaeum adminiculabundum]|nr:Aspartate-semialdehyde dehydrogenase [Candidatus Gugararchaeum adminiculabundum]